MEALRKEDVIEWTEQHSAGFGAAGFDGDAEVSDNGRKHRAGFDRNVLNATPAAKLLIRSVKQAKMPTDKALKINNDREGQRG